jgi:uncharacterized membrane protein
MKIKFLNGLLIIDILTILLILSIAFIPSSAVRILLGLPFLLFFPGYTLVAALFARREGMAAIERIALSFGMSIALTALIGLGLNYTPWGISLLPVLYSISVFIIIMSGIALLRRARLPESSGLIHEYHFRFPGWEGSVLNKTLTVVLALVILATIGMLGYTIASPKTGEKFTEFYILGMNGKAADYPSEIILNVSQVSGVKYGEAYNYSAKNAQVILGIVNHEQQTAVYNVRLQIDGQPADILYNGQSRDSLADIRLDQGQKWEQTIGFAPVHLGENQKVEIFLYKDGTSDPENALHLWVTVKSS